MESAQFLKEPTFQLLKPNGWEATDDFQEHRKLLEDDLLPAFVRTALRTAHDAGCFFRGIYPLPIALGEHGYEHLKLPWFPDYFDFRDDGTYQPVQSADAEIQRLAEQVLSLEHYQRGASFLLPVSAPKDQRLLQSLAVEVMLAADSSLSCVLASDLQGAYWWQSVAFENLIECHGQASVVFGTERIGASTKGCIQPAALRKRVRKALPQHY